MVKYFNSSESVALQIIVKVLTHDRAFTPRRQTNLAAGFSSVKFRPIPVSTLTLYGIVSPRCVWCERTVRESRVLSIIVLIRENPCCWLECGLVYFTRFVYTVVGLGCPALFLHLIGNMFLRILSLWGKSINLIFRGCLFWGFRLFLKSIVLLFFNF